MKIQELRRMNFNDLQAKLAESSDEIFKLKFRLVTQPLDNPLRIRQIRRDIARIKTLMRERDLTGVAPNAPTAPKTTTAPKTKSAPKTTRRAK